MSSDRAFIERNRASTSRIRDLAARLTDEQLQHPVGEHWTVAITLAHLAFWDRWVLYLLDQTERQIPKPKGLGLVSGATDESASETIGCLTAAQEIMSAALQSA